MNTRRRILLSAYFCSPYRGGESAVGWQVAIGLAKYHDVTLICGDLSKEARTAHDLERFKTENVLPSGLKIVHVQAQKFSSIINDLHCLPALWFLYYVSYHLWQKQSFQVAKRLHSENPFDLVHHVNIIGFREPGYLWQLGIPFFWGPISGTTLVPNGFFKNFGAKEYIRWWSRNLLNRWQIYRGGRPAQAARAAAKVWTISETDRAAITRWGAASEAMLETGCTPRVNPQEKVRHVGEPLLLCWSGTFLGIKALPLLLHALARSGRQEYRLDVLGDGKEAKRWKKLAEELGLAGIVQWHGMLPRDGALKVMQGCHVLVHTSVKEGTPHVVLEALAMGLPVICHDACGMGTAVTSDCGIKVPLRDPSTSIHGFRLALEQLNADSSLLISLAQGAIKRANDLTWDVKISRYMEVYQQVLDSRKI